MERIIRQESEIERVDWLIGASAPQFYYNMLMNQDDASTYAAGPGSRRERAISAPSRS